MAIQIRLSLVETIYNIYIGVNNICCRLFDSILRLYHGRELEPKTIDIEICVCYLISSGPSRLRRLKMEKMLDKE